MSGREWAILAAVLLAVPAVVVVRWFFGGTDPGTAIAVANEPVVGVVPIRFPASQVPVAVAAPRDDVDDGRGEQHRAARGATFVWAKVGDEESYAGSQGLSGALRTDDEPRFDLVTDGRTYPLVAGRGRYLAVRGDGRDVHIRATFAGVTQSVDPRTGERDAGRAASLYAPPSRRYLGRAFDCAIPDDAPGDADDRTLCVVGPAGRVPFTAEGGWAPSGREWVVVDVATLSYGILDERATRRTGREVEYEPEIRRWAVTLDGEPPLSVPRVQGAGRSGFLAFPSRPDAPRKLRLDLVYGPRDPRAPQDVVARVDSTIDLDD